MSRKSTGTAGDGDQERCDWSGVAYSPDGTSIHYDIYAAAVTSPSSTLVLIIPGFWRHRRYPTMTRLARFIRALGFPVAILDMRGHGESGGTFGFNLREHEDVEAVGRAIMSKLEVTSFILVGFSLGGAIAISTAARTSLPIRALLLISPVADVSRVSPHVNPFLIHRHIAFSLAFSRPRFRWRFRSAEKIRALDDIAKVAQPVLLIHVKDDWLVGHEHSLSLFAEAVEPKEMRILDLPGNMHADRIFTHAASAIEPLLRDFLAKNK